MTKRIILIGAARSGTKIVRDMLAEAARTGRVPYDIGFVWRYRNEPIPHDVLDAGTVTPKIRRFIRNYIDAYAAGRPPVVIEKTVGNALRVPFVHAVLPDAVFIHLIRNGIDVAESTRRQWFAPPERTYLARKMRHFPLRLVPSYGRKYAASQLTRHLRNDARVGTWGPRYPGIDQDARSKDLLSVCARQWRLSVELASEALNQIDARCVELRYEQLIAEPRETLEALLSELELDVDSADLQRAVSMLNTGGTKLRERVLEQGELQQLQRDLGPTLVRLGYLSATKPGVTDGS
jgi:cation diffusion facilitator CzcD-associated flavoprotein CzcO